MYWREGNPDPGEAPRISFQGTVSQIGRSDPALEVQSPHLNAVTMRSRMHPQNRPVLDTWFYPLALGQPLPPLPLWLDANLAVSLDVEGSYEDACRALRIV